MKKSLEELKSLQRKSFGRRDDGKWHGSIYLYELVIQKLNDLGDHFVDEKFKQQERVDTIWILFR